MAMPAPPAVATLHDPAEHARLFALLLGAGQPRKQKPEEPPQQPSLGAAPAAEEGKRRRRAESVPAHVEAPSDARKAAKARDGLATGFLGKKAPAKGKPARQTASAPLAPTQEPQGAKVPAFDIAKLNTVNAPAVPLVLANAVDDRDRIVPPWFADRKRPGPPDFGATQDQLAAMDRALALVQRNEAAAAEAILKPLLTGAPHHPHPFFFLGFALQGRGELAEACTCYSHALARQPFLIAARTNLVLALSALERNDEASKHAIDACRHEPSNSKRFFEAGVVLQKRELHAEASHYYQQALVLDPTFKEAYVNNDAALLAAGATVWCRAFARCAHAHFGSNFWRNEWQRPPHFVASLSSKPYWDAEAHALCRDLENNFAAIRDEALAVMGQASPWGNVGARSTHDASLVSAGTWREYPLLCGDSGGASYTAHRAACPVTTRVLESHPCARLCAQHGVGESLFSRLAPGSRLRPHCGSTNVRLTCHLGLVVPDGCTLTVGGSSRTWEEGRCVVFDDSFEHEVHHGGPPSSSVDRLVLLVNFYHPEFPPSAWRPLAVSASV